MDEYRSYYQEEEIPSPNPAKRLLLGIIIGLIVGVAIGIAIGIGINADIGTFIETANTPVISESIIVVLTIVLIIVLAILKGSRATARAGHNTQAMVWIVVMGVVLFLLLAVGVYFILIQ